MPQIDQIVVGAGMSGMTTTLRAQQAGKTVLLLEQSHRVGGLMGTMMHQGYLLEMGPHTFPSSATNLLHLCQELDLKPQAVSNAAKHRYLVRNSILHAVPQNPFAFLQSSLLTPTEKIRLLLEPFQQATQINEDESVASFIKRRLGLAALEYLASPFLTGIYAGDPEQLSLQAIFPLLATWERMHGSLLKGAVSHFVKRQTQPLQSSSKAPLTLLGFPQGMQVLVDALHQQVHSNLKLGYSVQQIKRQPNGNHCVSVKTSESETVAYETNSITLALPAYEAARLLKIDFPEAASELAEIQYAPVSVLHIGLPRLQIAHALNGFGFLVPQREGLPLLGCIWASTLFSERAPSDHVLLTVMLGGILGEAYLRLDPDILQTQVLAALETLLGIRQIKPDLVHRIDWPQAIPQYTLGHMLRISRIQAALAGSGITLSGNYLKGVALNCLVS